MSTVLSVINSTMGSGVLERRCWGGPVSFLQLAIKPVQAVQWDGIVVPLRNYYRKRADICTRRDELYMRSLSTGSNLPSSYEPEDRLDEFAPDHIVGGLDRYRNGGLRQTGVFSWRSLVLQSVN
jgi:hypothetical protein